MRTHAFALFLLGSSVVACSTSESSEPSHAGADAEPDSSQVADAAADVTSDADSGGQRYQPLRAAIQEEMKQSGVVGASVAIVEHGELTFAEGFGMTSTSSDAAPVLPSTRFRLGAMSATLVAAGMLSLVSEGRIALDDTVTKHVPEMVMHNEPDWFAAIRIRDLLDYGSGMPYGWPGMDFGTGADAIGPEALEHAFIGPQYADNMYLESPPGEVWSYSECSYSLAALVLQRAGGKYYRDVLQERVFTPLGMDRTTYSLDEVKADGDWAESQAIAENDVQSASTQAFSTVLDLAKFAQMLIDGNPAVMSATEASQMTSPQINMWFHLDKVQAGLGVRVGTGLIFGDDYFELDAGLVSASGTTAPYGAHLVVIPSMKFAMISLSTGNAHRFPKSLRAALSTLLGYPEIASTVVLDTDLTRYAGTYVSKHVTGVVVAEVVDTKLRISAGSAFCNLENIDYANFRCPLNGFYYIFLPGPDGKIKYLEQVDGPVAIRVDASDGGVDAD